MVTADAENYRDEDDIAALMRGVLTEREKTIMRLRCGLFGESPMTLREIGVIIGPVHRERVRQIEAKALRKLRTARIRERSVN